MKKKEEDKEKNVETWMKENEEVGRRRKYIKRANERHYQGWRTMKDQKKEEIERKQKRIQNRQKMHNYRSVFNGRRKFYVRRRGEKRSK